MALESEKVNSLCDAVLQLGGVAACVVFDSQGRRAAIRANGGK